MKSSKVCWWINHSIAIISIFIVPMCKTTSPMNEAFISARGENFEGAKSILMKTLNDSSYWRDIAMRPNEGRAEALYLLAYVQGRLQEYDSMKIACAKCLTLDANQKKSVRLLLEYFYVVEYNKAVNAYNNFFFQKAAQSFQRSLSILGDDTTYAEFTGLVYRNLAYTYASMGDEQKAIGYCKKAAGLGDALSSKVLEMYNTQKKFDKPDKLEPRKENPIVI